jgi:hypothetical protein
MVAENLVSTEGPLENLAGKIFAKRVIVTNSRLKQFTHLPEIRLQSVNP